VSSNANNWVTFQLVGTKNNRMAIRAQLKLTTEDGASQYDVVSTSAGFGLRGTRARTLVWAHSRP
jgi:hypothetical protein